MPQIFDSAAELPPGLLESCPRLPHPARLLMCPPKHFRVVDVKNPHMEGKVGTVDAAKAGEQWDEVLAAFNASGIEVDLIEPLADCEDMVFCANQTFVGPKNDGKKLCVLSNMTHASRRREVPAFEKWFAAAGYQIERVPESIRLEGSGDAIWHPGRRLIWGGHGYRTAAEAYPILGDLFDAPVLRLALRSPTFYHLDTCFCAVDEQTALIHVPSLAPESVAMIRKVFQHVIECPDEEALKGMACNACSLFGRKVVIQENNPVTVAALRKRGCEVQEVDTAEFMKSGGSVFCMKMYVF